MLNSIKARLIVAGIIMAVLLGGLIYFTSAQMKHVDEVLANLESLQDVKTHVMAPQKDMNQFIAAMDSTVLFIELGDAESAQAAYDSSVDAEQDISGEFEYLEQNAPTDLLPMIQDAHLGWETATEFMKRRAEAAAAESDVALVRPVTDAKIVDVHTETSVTNSTQSYDGLSFAEMTAIYQDREKSPVEVADEGIDGSDEAVTERLETERAAGEKAIKGSSNTLLAGSLGILVAILSLGGIVTLSVSKPLSALKKGAEKIADGDLDYEFKNVPDDEVGAVIHSVEKMAGGLKTRIRNLEEVAGIVMVTGEEIGEAAAQAKAGGADVDGIIVKADQLKGLVGQMLADTQ